MLTTDEVAKRLGYSVKYFQNNWRKIKGLPDPHRHEYESGGKSHPKWDAGAIEAFLAGSKQAA